MLKTYQGSCHCGAVRFEADIDLSAGTSKCNCSMCTKNRSWSAMVKPDAFRLLSKEDSVSDYQHGGKTIHFLFCRHCGIRPFGRGYLEELGGDFVSVQVATLDNATPEELIAAKVNFANGRDNDWWSEPAEVRHL
jgi:hypothetical protein